MAWQTPAVIDAQGDLLQVAWNAPITHGSPITSYELAFDGDLDGSGSGLPPVTLPGGTSVLRRQYVLTNLDFSTSVSFQVRALNAYGSSDWSSPTSGTTLPGPPSISGNVQVGTPLRTSLTWSWQAADGHGVLVDMYQVSVCRGCTSCTEVSREVLPAATLSYTADGLAPNTYYRLRVRANSSSFPDFNTCIGGVACSWKTSGCQYTRDYPGVPGYPTQWPSYGAIDTITNLWVRWAAAANHGSTIDNYQVDYAVTDRNGAQSMISRTTPSPQLLITGLLPESTVEFTVRAHNAWGWGNETDTANFSTTAAVPPQQPEAPRRATLQGDVSNVTTIAITWTPPVSVGVPILSYRVYVDDDPYNSPSYDGTDLGFQLAGLSNGSVYSFRVVAVNEAGPSEMSPTANISTWPGRVPQQPQPPYIDASDAANPLPGSSNPSTSSAMAVLLYWVPPYDFEQTLTGYAIYVDGPNVAMMRHPVPTGALSSINPHKLITGLTPNSTYRFYLEALNVEGPSSPSAPFVHTTDPATPPETPAAPVPAPYPNFANQITFTSFQWYAPPSLYEVDRYRLYRDGHMLVDNLRALSYLDNVHPLTNYSYQVRAVSTAGESALSAPIYIATLEPIVPTTPNMFQRSLPVGYYPVTTASLGWDMHASGYAETGGTMDRYQLRRCMEPSAAECTYLNISAATSSPASLQTSLSPNTTYFFSARAHNRDMYNVPIGWSDWSAELEVTTANAIPPARPAAPIKQNVAWENNATSIRVAWSRPVSYGLAITRYDLEYDGTWLTNIGRATSYTRRGLMPSTTHFFRVRAYNMMGVSEESDVLNATTAVGQKPNSPGMPVDVGVLCCGLSNITSVAISWTRPSSDLPIHVYLLTINGSSTTIPSTTNSYTFTNLYPGSSFNVSVQAFSSAGVSSASDASTFTLAPPVVPETPAVPFQTAPLTGISQASHLTIAWPAVASCLPIVNYAVLLTDETNQVTEHRWTNSTQRTFAQLGLQPGGNFSFSVAAENSVGLSGFSTPLYLTTLQAVAPQTPLNVRTEVLCCGLSNVSAITIVWDRPPSDLQISGYLVDINGTAAGAPRSNTYTLSNLFPGSMLNVSVRATSAGGVSDPTSTIDFVLEQPTAPLTPYRMYSGYQNPMLDASTNMRVSWATIGAYDQRALQPDMFELYFWGSPQDDYTDSRAPVIIPGGYSRSHTFYQLLPEHNYTFSMRAHNPIGWGPMGPNATISTPQGRRPDRCNAPGRETNQQWFPSGYSTAVSVFVSWSGCGSPAYPILSHKVKVLDANGTQVWEEETSGIRQSYLFHCNYADFTSITDQWAAFSERCTPNTTFYFSVAARNQLGLGEYSAWVPLSTTPPIRPDAPDPVQLSQSTNYWYNKTTIRIVWSEPVTFGLPIDQYEIQIFNQVNESSDGLELMPWTGPRVSTNRGQGDCYYSDYVCSVFTAGRSRTLSLPVYYPLSNRTFRIRARSILGGGYSYWSDNVTFGTGPPGLPTTMSAPVHREQFNLQGSTNCTAFIFMWSNAHSSAQTIIRYESILNDDNNTILEWTGSDRFGFYTQLRPGTLFALKMRAINEFRGSEYGAGEWSAPMYVWTEFSSLPYEPDPPERVFVPGLAPTTIAVRYQARSLCASVSEMELQVDGTSINLPANGGNDCWNFYYIYDQVPGSNHTFRVRARNEEGDGPWSANVTYVVNATAPSRPDLPPILVTLNQSAVELLLPHPAANGEPIDLMRVEWLVGSSNTILGSAEIDVRADVNLTFVHLPREAYNASESYRYLAHNAKGWSEPSPLLVAGNQITFEPAAPDTPQLVSGTLTPRATNITFEKPTSTANPYAQLADHPVVRVDVTMRSDVPNAPIEVRQLASSELDLLCGLAIEGPCGVALTGLTPATVYHIKLAAFSGGADGSGSRYSPELMFETPAAAPSVVRNVLAVVQGAGANEVSDAISVSWDPPLASNGRSIRAYIAWACDVQEPGACWNNATLAMTATIDGLTPGRNYTVAVEAVNDAGSSGNTSALLPFYTTYASPFEPPEPYLGPELLGLPNTTFIHAVWDVPYANGLPITHYGVVVDDVSSEIPVGRGSFFPQQIFADLIPGTWHNLSVQAINSKGASPLSPLAAFRTAEDVPGRPPPPIVTNSGPQTLDVSIAPAPYSGGSPIQWYELSITTSVGTTVAFVYPPTLQYTIADRAPDLEYSLSVVARNGLGPSSPSSDVISASIALSTTPRQPEEFAIGDMRIDSFDVTWRLPNNSFPVAYYLVRLHNSSGFTTVRVERNLTNDCRVELCVGVVPGLRAFTAYNVSIAAVSFSDQPGFYSNQHAIFTLASVPEPVHPPPVPTLITNTSISLSWTVPADNGYSIEGYVAWACPCDTARTLQSYTYVRSCVRAAGVCTRADPTTTAAVLTSLTPGTMYMLAVEALNALGSSGNSTAADAATTVGVPAQCASPTLGPSLGGLDPPRQQYIVWTAPPDNTRAISQYELRNGGSNAEPLVFNAPTSSVSPPQYLATGLTPHTEYTYQVRAINSEGAGGWSPLAAFRTAKDVPSRLQQPTVFTDTPDTLAVEIGPVTYDGGEAVTAYEVVYCEEQGIAICFAGGPSDHAVNVTTDGSSIVGFSVPQRLQGTVYRFRARAWSALGAGAWSTELVVGSGSTAVRPASVRDVAIVTTTDCTASVSWTRSSTASDILYDVQLDCAYGTANAYVLTAPLSLTANGTTCSGTASACSWCADSLLPHGMLQCDALVRARRGSLYATTQYALSRVASATGPEQPGTPIETGVSQNAAQLAWTMPTSYGAVVTGYQLEVAPTAADGVTPIGAWMTESAGAMATSLSVSNLQPGMGYLARLRAQNTLGLWSAWSAHLGVHTTARPDRPTAATYAPGYSHEEKIHSIHLQWSMPNSHGLPLAAQQLAVDDRIYPFDPNTTTYAVNGLAANTRLRVRVRFSNALGWSDWSADAFLVTDPDVPAVDPPPTCGDIFAHINGTTIQFESITVDLPSAGDNGEAITLRRLRIFNVGRSQHLGGGAGAQLSSNVSIVNISDAILSSTHDGEHPLKMVNVSAGTESAIVPGLFPGGCYRMQLASENALGWSAYSGSSDVCCTFEPEVLMEMVDVASVAITGLGIGILMLICCIFMALFLIIKKYRQMFSGYNATIFGSRQKLEDEIDGSKRVEKYMDNQYTPGIDDADDLTVNPVFLHKIDMEKQAKLRGKRAKIGACGQDAGNRSGGLKRLGFFMEEKQKTSGGKSKTMADVEKFLSGQHGVDISEARVMKNTRAGTKKGNVLLAAQATSQPSGLATGNARAMARAAARAGAEADGEEGDDSGTGQQYTAAL